MKKELIYIKEPRLLFGYNQKFEDPRDGLTLFGPLENNCPYGILSGVVGTFDGLRKYKSYVYSLKKQIYNKNNITRPYFPGFESIFNMKWDTEKISFEEITNEEIEKYIRYQDVHERTFNLVNLFADKIINAVKNKDEKNDIWFIVIPDNIYQYCRPQSAPPENVTTLKSMSNSYAKQFIDKESLFDNLNEDAKPYKYEAHFHNQLKARLLEHSIPTQILRESTLAYKEYVNSSGRLKRDFSKIEGHVAWSISTAAFYKAGGKPWKLGDIRDGVCYVGLVYKRDETSSSPREACCAAQMFLDNGDGTVFKGAVGPWYNEKTNEYHLKEKQAGELMEIVVKTYKDLNGKEPKELFIHGRTKFDNIEWKGFQSSVPDSTNLVGITIYNRKPLKLYRKGSDFPVLRGLAFVQSENSAYLWTKGFVPKLQTSLSLEVPNPLYIEISKGKVEIETVLKDILALTKLNYNACIYGDGIPVTLRFADAVGEILTASPQKECPPLSFKYYI